MKNATNGQGERMHRIIRSHLTRFSKNFEISGIPEDDQFEMFANYCCVSSFAAGRFDPAEVTTGSDDSGIDGVCAVIDDEVVTTAEDAIDFFKAGRRSREVTLIFVQAKSGERFSKSDLVGFGSAVCNFLSEEPSIPLGEAELEARDVFDVLVENLHKIRGGQLACRMFFVNSGQWVTEDETLAGAIDHSVKLVEKTEFFSSVDYAPVDRHRLRKMWTETYEPVEANFRVLGYAPIPQVSGVTQAYMAVVPARGFVDGVLDGGDGRIRASVFQENVRSFLGIENRVNSRIGKTLSTSGARNRFAVLNNGVTIVAPEVKVASDRVNIRNFQIVNGCQTSHVLFEHRQEVDDSVMIPMKIIETDDVEVVAQIVEATNSQSQIAATQFLSLKAKVRDIEAYFDTFDGNQQRRIYLERRERQFAGMEVAAARILDIQTLARAFAAMFTDQPHLSARYPKRLLSQMGESLFDDSNRVEAYYAAGFTYYRLQSLISNRVFPGTYTKYRWHLLMVLKYLVLGKKIPALNSQKMSRAADSIAQAVRRGSADALFAQCTTVFDVLGNPSRDAIKTPRFAATAKAAALRVRSESNGQ